jgi:hypothetical protein
MQAIASSNCSHFHDPYSIMHTTIYVKKCESLQGALPEDLNSRSSFCSVGKGRGPKQQEEGVFMSQRPNMHHRHYVL